MSNKTLDGLTHDEIKDAVKEKYSKVAKDPCATFNFPVGKTFALKVGYPKEILDKLPQSMYESFTGANNPQPFVELKKGEVVLDLGCGAGLDLYFYAQAVGENGKVYGLDISEDMVNKAKKNMELIGINPSTMLEGYGESFDYAQDGSPKDGSPKDGELVEPQGRTIKNVEIKCGHSDNLPFPDNFFDVVASNGIYNLSPDKEKVMREVFRVLKPEGRTVFCEIVLKERLPEGIRKNIDDWFRCIGGALPESEFLTLMRKAGFKNIEVISKCRNARTGHPSAICANIRAYK